MTKFILGLVLILGFSGIASAQSPSGESGGCNGEENRYFQWLCNNFGGCGLNGDTTCDDYFAPGGAGYDMEYDLPDPARCSPEGWCEAFTDGEQPYFLPD